MPGLPVVELKSMKSINQIKTIGPCLLPTVRLWLKTICVPAHKISCMCSTNFPVRVRISKLKIDLCSLMQESFDVAAREPFDRTS